MALSVRTVKAGTYAGWALVLFILLAFLPAVILPFVELPSGVPYELLLILGSWAPNIAALIVLGLFLREPGGLRRLLAGWLQWRVGVGWYLTLLIPVGIAALAVVGYRLGGGQGDAPAEAVDAGLILGLAVMTWVTGALGEELGWRGFLLPRLQRWLAAVPASLVVGVLWSLWHLPRWFLPGRPWETLPFWSFAATALFSSVLYTWLVNGTGGSLLLVSAFHFSVNFANSSISIFGCVPDTAYFSIIAVLYALAAAVVIWRYGSSSLSPNGRLYTAEPDPG